LFAAVISGITSYEVSQFWGVGYRFYPVSHVDGFSKILFAKILIIGVVCGLAALLFVSMFEELRIFFNYIQQRFQIWNPLMPTIGGLILAIFILFIPTDYLGLSIPAMEEALHGEAMPFMSFLWKSLLVAVTLGSGYYGGIVTPQFLN